MTIDTSAWTWGDVPGGVQRQHFRIRYVALNKATAILDWEFDIDWTNACYNVDVDSWTTEAANINYSLKETYDAADKTAGTSAVSAPVFSIPADCKQVHNLEYFEESTQ